MMTRLSACLLALHFLSAGSAVAQRPERTSTDVAAGFGFGPGTDTNLKIGHWTPVSVAIGVANGDFRGEVQLTTVDSEGYDTTVVIPNVNIPATTSRTTTTVSGLVKFGRIDLDVDVKLVETIDPNSPRVVDQRRWKLNDENRRPNIIQPNQPFVVYFGSAGGLYEVKDVFAKAQVERGAADDAPALARMRAERDFPTQWYGYGGVDVVVLTTSDPLFFDRLDSLRADALRAWVRQGGHLVVSAAKNWQIVDKSFLGPMLPAKLIGAEDLQLAKTPVHEKLESYAGVASNDFKRHPTMQTAKLGKIRGEPIQSLQQGEHALAVVGAYGLGRVTLLTFDAEEAPFKDWKGASQFWTKLLKLRLRPNDERSMGRGFGGASADDLSARVNNHLENFPDVTVVPFGWVALLIFLYILLIGPVDYFFLKKVVKRLELTWITFPTWVVVISAAAYYSAYLLKGDDLRLNRLEIVDVDATTGTLRGTGFLGVFSPQIARYDVAYTPLLASGGKFSELAAGGGSEGGGGLLSDDQVASVSSWQGIPDNSARGIGSEGSASLLGRRSYRFRSLDGGEVVGVAGAPIQVWSVKTFTGQWLGKAAPVVEAKLTVDGALLRGTITNQLSAPLINVVLAFGEQAYQVSKIEANATIDLSALQHRSLDGLIGEGSKRVERGPFNKSIEEAASDLDGLVLGLLFSRNHLEHAPQNLGNYYLSSLDLSHQLELGRAILLAHIAPAAGVEGGRLWLNDAPGVNAAPKPLPNKTVQHTFLRVVLQPSKENE